MKKILSMVLTMAVIVTTIATAVMLAPVSTALSDFDLLAELGQSEIVIEDGQNDEYWQNIELNLAERPYLHLTVRSEVPFNISLYDQTTPPAVTGGAMADKWITMYGDYADMFGLSEVPADERVPAGTYALSLDLKSCYEYNGIYPEDGSVVLSGIMFEVTGAGHFEVAHMVMSSENTYAPMLKDIDLLSQVTTSDTLTITDGNAKQFNTYNDGFEAIYDGDTHPYLHLSVTSEVPFQIAFCDETTSSLDADGSV